MKRLKLFGYVGGKYYQLNTILKLIPPHRTYIEVFGGSGTVLLNKISSKVEIFNDIDDNITTLFKILQTRPNEFKEKIKYFLYSEKLWQEARNRLNNKYTDDLEKAIDYYFYMIASVGGTGSAFGLSYETNMSKRMLNKILNIDNIIERIQNVQIINRDFRRVLIEGDKRDDVFFYLDPPYIVQTSNKYKYNFSLRDHRDLVNILLKLKNKALLTVYMNDIYKPLIDAGWSYRIDNKFICSGVNVKNRNYEPEYFIFNYEINNLFNT